MAHPIPSLPQKQSAFGNSSLPQSEPPKENRFSYLTLNMRYTLNAWNDPAATQWIQRIHRIARIALFPLLLIAACESIFKNGLFLIANLGIAIANKTYQILSPRKPPLPAETEPPAAPKRPLFKEAAP